MTQKSMPWAGSATGDCGPYSDDQWSDFWRKAFTLDRTKEGVLPGYLNQLAVSGVASPVAVASGGAFVDGKTYDSDASENVAIPTPSTNPRIDRIVLRKDFSAQTVRITRIAGTEAASPTPPALVQTDGTTWDVPLAQVLVTTGGVITVTDEREFAGTMLARSFMRSGGELTIASGVVTVRGAGFYTVDTQADASTDELDTINGGTQGQEVLIALENASRLVTLTEAGNIRLPTPSYVINNIDTLIRLRFDGTYWKMSGGGAGGGNKEVSLPAGAAYLPDDTANNKAATVQVKTSSAGTPKPRWYEALFDDTTEEWIYFQFRMPSNYVGSPTVEVHFKMASATSGNVVFGARIMATTPGDSQDVDADSFASDNLSSATAVAGTAGYEKVCTITLTNNDGLAAGDEVILAIHRAPGDAGDTASGDAEVRQCALKYE